MSKTALILIVLCGLAGLALVYFFDFNPVSSMTSFIQDPMGSLQNLPNTLISNWQPVATGVGGAISALALVSRTYSQKKQEAQEIQGNLQGEITAVSEAKAKVEGQVTAQETIITAQTDQLKAKEIEIGKLKDLVRQHESSIQRLQRDDHSLTKEQEDKLYNRVVKEVRKH